MGGTGGAPQRRSGEPEMVGYRAPTACAAAGITYRQLDYWARTGLVEPSVRTGPGPFGPRLYAVRDVVALAVVKRLLDAGVSQERIRSAARSLRERGVRRLADVTLVSDGASVHECASDGEVAALLRTGRGVFAIAVDAVRTDVEAALSALHAEPLPGTGRPAGDHPVDELARRRNRAG